MSELLSDVFFQLSLILSLSLSISLFPPLFTTSLSLHLILSSFSLSLPPSPLHSISFSLSLSFVVFPLSLPPCPFSMSPSVSGVLVIMSHFGKNEVIIPAVLDQSGLDLSACF